MVQESFLNSAIRLEHLAAELYLCFYHQFEIDASFWWHMVLEEKNHASILSFAQTIETDSGLPEPLQRFLETELQAPIAALEELISQVRTEEITRERALNIALYVEVGLGEGQFQSVIDMDSSNEVMKIFKQLKDEDDLHRDRIIEYMEKADIPIDQELFS
ncbi:MAG: hypothetical protein OCC49_14630 [Fibrobacterales bacterium]